MSDTLKHPFAFDKGRRIVPAEAADHTAYTCPTDECDDPLYARGPSIDGRVRHFYHPGSGGIGGTGHGGGGESPTHKNYKSHAASALITFFGDDVEETTVEECFEVQVDIPNTERDRVADALCTFKEPHDRFGKGVIIEVQHKNKGKDIRAVTEDYLSAGYSVYWTCSQNETHYTPIQYQFTQQDLADEAKTVWPDAVPIIEGTPYERGPTNFLYRCADGKYKIKIEEGIKTAVWEHTDERSIRLPEDWWSEVSDEIENRREQRRQQQRIDSLSPKEIPHPHQPWEVAIRCIQKACDAEDHDWLDLPGAPRAYWRECNTCRIADVTARAIGQDVAVPGLEVNA